jgi:hypothetical protein
MRSRLEEHLDHLNIREEAGGIVWVNPSSKCASCHSNKMHQRIIHTHVNVSSKAYVYYDKIYNFCARACFTGCTYLRHIILALDTVQREGEGLICTLMERVVLPDLEGVARQRFLAIPATGSVYYSKCTQHTVPKRMDRIEGT